MISEGPLEKLRLNDSSFTYEPETSGALGFGFRCGFLGLLHMEIVRERLERDFDLSLITTAPSVVYRVTTTRVRGWRSTTRVTSVDDRKWPALGEPFLLAAIITPTDFTGTSWNSARSEGVTWRACLTCRPSELNSSPHLPLAEVVFDFFDQMKSRTQGYASLDYEPGGLPRVGPGSGGHPAPGDPVDPFSTVVHRSAAEVYGRKMTTKFKGKLIPRQQFEVPFQAAIGGRVIPPGPTVRAFRKDVTAKLYGGDITRKRKLLEKQKEGKKKMKSIGGV
ncbi:MAG: hypothetical protein Ct9H300mP12_00480 [Acidimicrobiales bacterium]|nr:MAG: hypothetical protein Ct9H300mP12_00480 [Acidimicrobiales bacterium]